MKKKNLYAKRSKCAFATKIVEYLGHYIEATGISTDPCKIKAIAEWPLPKTVKQLRCFLGLAGYHRRFVKSFSAIAQPLTALTKKDAYEWNIEAQNSFECLKKALCQAPVLALPLFDKPFVVETDVCGQGIGAVLMQEGHPISYISRHLKGKQLHLSIYEKELLAVVFAVQKWRHYLLPKHFIIRTDQRSLKYLLEQRLNTPIQQQWLPKLLEFSYEIQYKQGKENIAADALSRVISQGIPKHSFVMWVLLRNSLPTRDRLRGWGLSVPAECLLCNAQPESRSHLFFDCPYSAQVWTSMLTHLRTQPPPPTELLGIVSWTLAPTNVQKLNIICKLVLQASIYEIWRERNVRLHLAIFCPATCLIKQNQLNIRAKLSSLDRKAQSSPSMASAPGDSFLITWFRYFQPR